MSIEADLTTALSGIVSDRFYAETFPQTDTPVWPAMRYLLWAVPLGDLCGDGDDSDNDARVQLDLVAVGYAELRALRLQVRTVMAAFDPPAIQEDEVPGFDPETKTHRCVLTYMLHPSSS